MTELVFIDIDLRQKLRKLLVVDLFDGLGYYQKGQNERGRSPK